MLKGGKLLIGCVMGVIGIIASFTVIFAVVTEFTRQQMPFGKDKVAEWMLGTPQPVARELQDNGYVNAGIGVGWKDFIHPNDTSPPSGIPFNFKPALNCLFQDPDYRRHTGVDFPEYEGSPVHATMAGLVVWAGKNGPWGQLVVVENNGYQTWYAHFSSISVSKGEVISQGTKVGEVGTTGNSTGNHLHYGIKKRVGEKGANWLNPLGYFDGASYNKVPCN
jgi:murein DD-endopeptidase MepM/ murein hydrolase activator NlpD